MMVEPGYVKCPKCGAPLEKKEIFNESVVQCTECDYKQSTTLDESSLRDNILEESG